MNSLTLVQFTYKPFSVQLGALYLVYGLEKANIEFELKIYHLYKENKKQGKACAYPDIDDLYAFLVKSGKIIAVGCKSDILPFLLVVLEKIKRKFPEKIIILGGIGPTVVAEEIMNKFNFINFIIKGCGVAPLPQLVKKIIKGENNFSDVHGLVCRNRHNIITNKYDGFYSHAIIPDVIPYHRLKNINSYNEFSIRTSSGCLYRCSFCQIYCLSKEKVMYENINKCIEGIKAIKKIKKNEKFKIYIDDEAFILNRERVIKFCHLLIAEKLNIRWGCYGRIDRMDRELLEVMSKSGCESIFYGIESGSNKILKKIKKGFTIEEVVKILTLSKKYIKRVSASFIYLYPFETKEDFIKTLFYVSYLGCKQITVRLEQLQPVKNSDIYFRYKKTLHLFKKNKFTFRPDLNYMPRECARLIKNNPDIFYTYYQYNFKELNKISKLAVNQEVLKLKTEPR